MHGSRFNFLDRKAALAVTVALGILLSVAAVADYRLRSFERSVAWVDHTHEVIEQLDLARTKLLLAESAHRAYLLAGDRGSRDAFARSAAEVPRVLQHIRRLTSDNAVQQQRIDTLDTVTRLLLTELGESAGRRDVTRPTSAQVAVADRLGHAGTDAFDALVDRMSNTERALLAERGADRRARLQRLSFNIKLSATLALVIILFAAVRAQRAAIARARAEAQRDASAGTLAQQSRELGARNAELVAQREALQAATRLAEEANHAKSLFLAQMSHELRTPLNSVIGFANIVRRNPRGVLIASEVTYLDRVVENGRHLLRIINSILDLSKIEARQETVELELVSLDELAREVLSSLEPQATAGGITLRLEAPAPLAMIVTDKEKLQRVLINLVANAVKFTKAAGSVTVRLETATRDRTSVTAIVVRDTGIGIAPGRLAAIFDAFEQGDVGVAREYGGTGLGLSISRALCRLLRCELTVTSELGAGSMFRIALPPADASAR